jgi:hypothetical protein
VKRKKANEDDLLSIPKYAERRGVVHRTVQKWIEEGKLKGATKRIGDRTFIDPVKADKVLPGRMTRSKPKAKKKPEKKKAKKKPGPKPKRSASYQEKLKDIEGSGLEDLSLTEARAINERWKARLAELQVKEKEGTLIPAEETIRAIGNIIRVSRDAFLNIPLRLAFELEGLSAKEIEKKLREEIDTVLEDLSNAIVKRFGDIKNS